MADPEPDAVEDGENVLLGRGDWQAKRKAHRVVDEPRCARKRTACVDAHARRRAKQLACAPKPFPRNLNCGWKPSKDWRKP